MAGAMRILLLVGSESGNAEMVADCVKDALEERDFEVEMVTGGGLSELRLDQETNLLLVTSTTGLGDVPQNIEPIYDELRQMRPPLGHVRYGLVGMGDRNYKETFCGGPKKWDALLSELGATRVGEPLLLDATDNPMPDEDAVNWLPTYLEAMG